MFMTHHFRMKDHIYLGGTLRIICGAPSPKRMNRSKKWTVELHQQFVRKESKDGTPPELSDSDNDTASHHDGKMATQREAGKNLFSRANSFT